MWSVLMDCRSFQVSEASTLPLKNGCGRFFIVSEIDMHKEYYCPECKTGHSPAHQYTEMFPSCERRTLEPTLILSAAGSRDHAKTSALPVVAQAWQESEADFISKSKGLSAKQSQLSSSLKTSLRSGHADLDVWCGDFPNSGMIVAGQLYLPRNLAPITSEKDGSYWPTPRTTGLDGGSNSRKAAKARGMWPTPTIFGNHQAPKEGTSRGTGLSTAVKRWPTPTARDSKSMAGVTRGANASPGGTPLPVAVGGQLNPTWVEWLMGYPLEWTALEDWATQWFRSKRAKRSSVSRESGVSA